MFSPAAQQPTKRYRTIVADPPWNYRQKWGGKELTSSFFKGGTERGAACFYPCMTQEELLNLPVGLWAMDNAHLYLWVTNAFMVQGHEIARAWGFEVKTIITWCKNQLGMGMWYRNTTEHILFAVRGSLKCLHKDVPTHFMAERHGHSEKPAAFYDMVQHMSLGPYLDVFARKQRFNWDCWGDEAYCFDDGHAYWHDKGTA